MEGTAGEHQQVARDIYEMHGLQPQCSLMVEWSNWQKHSGSRREATETKAPQREETNIGSRLASGRGRALPGFCRATGASEVSCLARAHIHA